MAKLRARQRLDKYRIERRLSDGGFAVVYEAMDTIEGVRVALKVPHADIVNEDVLKDFRKEARIAARMEHPNVLPLKNACFAGEHFVIAFPLGERTLADRLLKRMGATAAIDYAEQMLEAAAYAHRQRIVHCDIKPENLIIFPGNRLKLTDFGIAKVAQKTMRGSGTGTVGYMAPEQAMGKPSLRSDVFSLGLVMYRMLTGTWPEWPFDWPGPGYHRLRGRIHPDMIALLKKSIEPIPRKRFKDADDMLKRFKKIKQKTLRHYKSKTSRKTKSRGSSAA